MLQREQGWNYDLAAEDVWALVDTTQVPWYGPLSLLTPSASTLMRLRSNVPPKAFSTESQTRPSVMRRHSFAVES